jgi:hypothetical protein
MYPGGYDPLRVLSPCSLARNSPVKKARKQRKHQALAAFLGHRRERETAAMLDRLAEIKGKTSAAEQSQVAVDIDVSTANAPPEV